MVKKKFIIISSKRKSAVAKVKIFEGKGDIFYNKLPYQELSFFNKLGIMEPIKICEDVLGDFKFDIEVKTVGGGKESQIQATRTGIANALVKFTGNEKLRESFLKYDRGLLVADVRRKEACKPGDSKARAKRQKSYR
jgi:small subunit ribosomal protein S9